MHTVLDALQALRDRAQAAREAFDVGGRRQVQRAERKLLGLGGAIARIERTADRAGYQRILDQVSQSLAELVLGAVSQTLAQPRGHSLPVGHPPKRTVPRGHRRDPTIYPDLTPMQMRLFTFVQLELPWELGPADGRYLLRKPIVAPGAREPAHVVVLSTVGAERRGLLGRRTRTRPSEREPPPTPVPVTRATIIDPAPLSVESQAQAWLRELDPEREAQAATDVLNRMLFAHRIAGAAPHIHEVSPAQALVLRAGFGDGEHVADGLWTSARELLLSNRRAGRRASVLRPQERLASLLSARESHLLCEELALRARLDLDGARLALAAFELERAYVAALAELPREQRNDLRARIEELKQLQPGVKKAADKVLPPSTQEPEEQTVRHALERLEAALRARTAHSSTLQ